MLLDTGAMLTLIDPGQPDFDRCSAVFDRARLPLITTWPCLAEAMHLAWRDGRFPFQEAIWRMRTDGFLRLHNSSNAEADRMADLMAQYRNVPMDLADASLIAAAEATGQNTLFTLDSDFRIYRLPDGSALKLLPE